MMPQQINVSAIADESSAQSYLHQAVMTTFCRVLDASRLPPVVVLRLLASALGTTYREVAAVHQDELCQCGWCPLPSLDVETLCARLVEASSVHRTVGLSTMVVAGRA
jgi:hypothetical protein